MSKVTRVVTLTINDKEVSAREDESILTVAREHEIDIPTLCYLEGLAGWGSCRLCLVQVEGIPKLLPACMTYCTEGMKVKTDTEKIQNYRKNILEMLFSERNHVCSVCVSNGACELQSLAQKCGMDHVSLPYRFPSYDVDSTHNLFRNDHNRCVLCTRCIRVCDEIEGAHVWDLAGRGIDTHVISELNGPWGDSETCTNCGKCVQVCPTGALVQKGTAVAEMHKNRTFLPYLNAMRGNNG